MTFYKQESGRLKRNGLGLRAATSRYWRADLWLLSSGPCSFMGAMSASQLSWTPECPSLGFAPTRLNTADAPTRDRDLPMPAVSSILDFLSPQQAIDLHSRQFSKGATGWIRLYILAVVFFCPVESCKDDWPVSDVSGFWNYFALPSYSTSNGFFVGLLLLAGLCTVIFSHQFSAWTSLGAPQRDKFSPLKWIKPFLALSLMFLAVPIPAMPLLPSGSEEQSRAARRTGNVLQADRVVLQQTRTRRETLLSALTNGWHQIGAQPWRPCSAAQVLTVKPSLRLCGKDLYQAGKSYGKFSETINAVTAQRPVLRRQVGIAWDPAFNWVVDEPHEHHAALSRSLLLSRVALALLWGWAL